MANDFLAQVGSAFGFLVEEHDFRLGEYFPPRHFDNAAVHYHSATLALLVGRERGQCFVNVGAAPVARFDLDLICRFVGDLDAQRVVSRERPSLSDLAAVVRRHLNELESLFGQEERIETENRLRHLGEARATELFGWPGPAERPPNEEL